MDSSLWIVGEYPESFNVLTGQTLPCGPIFQAAGLKIHIQKHHPSRLPDLVRIPEIIVSPDYIGSNPNVPNSVELVKVLDENIMIAIKLDAKNDYLFVASMYEISSSKMQRHLSSGRLKPFP